MKYSAEQVLQAFRAISRIYGRTLATKSGGNRDITNASETDQTLKTNFSNLNTGRPSTPSSQSQPITQIQSFVPGPFHTSPPRYNFGTDVMFGYTANWRDNSVSGLVEAAMAKRAATDIVQPYLSAPRTPEEKEASAAYQRAYEEVGGSPSAQAGQGRPFEELNFASGSFLESPDTETYEGMGRPNPQTGYGNYMAQVLKTVQQRGGKCYFHLGGFNVRRYCAMALLAEIEHAKSFEDYVLTGNHPHPDITLMEFEYAFRGKGKELVYSIALAPGGRELDGTEFRRLLENVVKASRSEANRAAMRSSLSVDTAPSKCSAEDLGDVMQKRNLLVNKFQFTREAEEAIAALTRYIEG